MHEFGIGVKGRLAWESWDDTPSWTTGRELDSVGLCVIFRRFNCTESGIALYITQTHTGNALGQSPLSIFVTGRELIFEA